MIVVDASVALLALLRDGEARTVLSEEAIACPHLIDSEIAHALRRQVRAGDLDPDDGRRAVETWARMGVDRMGAVGLLGRIWELRDNLTAYDATYVALAEAIEAPLVTMDRRLARAPGPRCTVTVVRS